ncbi:MAG: hypothetical protein O6916_06525 [bacterium]|nr:hypothetical protein [bacterium]
MNNDIAAGIPATQVSGEPALTVAEAIFRRRAYRHQRALGVDKALS